MRMIWIGGYLALAGVLALVSMGCNRDDSRGKVSAEIEQTLRWNGRLADSYKKDSLTGGMGGTSRTSLVIHTFHFNSEDSLRLILSEYPEDYLAFEAFQTKASREQMQEGIILQDNRSLFIHGAFFGEITFQSGGGPLDSEYLKAKLSFNGESLFLLPQVFLSFPLAQRIPFSERVNTRYFLGLSITEPVFSIRYATQGDTSIFFRQFSNSRDAEVIKAAFTHGHTQFPQEGETLFIGSTDLKRPLVFWAFKGGTVGAEGSFNQDFALENLKKMRKMTLLLKNP